MQRIILIFAGRTKYLQCLIASLQKQRSSFDKLHICCNFRSQKDEPFINTFAESHKDYVTLFQHQNIQLGYGEWYNQQKDKDAVYLKLDDDIVYIGDGGIAAIFAYRIANPTPLVVSGNVINNEMSDFLRGQARKTHKATPVKSDLDKLRSTVAGISAHKNFLVAAKSGNIESFKIPATAIPSGLRWSINAICFFGRDIPDFEEYQSDETTITTTLPQQTGRPSVICGDAIFVHFSLATQAIGSTSLHAYRSLAGLKGLKGLK